MNALYFLDGYRKAERQIELLNLEKKKLKEVSDGITIDPTKEHVQSSGNKDTVGRLAVKLASVQEDIDDAKEIAEEELETIIHAINLLPDHEEAQILFLKHIELMGHKDIQDQMQMAERTEYRKYNKGLESMQKILNNFGS